MCSVLLLSLLGLILIFVYPFQAPPWHYKQKKDILRHMAQTANQDPASINVQLKPIAEEREETEEEVHLLNSTTL